MNEERMLEKLIQYLVPKIKEHPSRGRPNCFTNEKLIEGIFYVAKYGVSWKLASKMTFGNSSYCSTLNRRYNQLIDDGIISETYTENIQNYINDNKIDDLFIDSMDIINGNCSKKYTGKSHKLHKQAVRTTIICTDKRIPLAYQTDQAISHDSKLGFNAANKFRINDGRIRNLAGDKGYQMTEDNKKILLNVNKLRLVYPKKRYRKKVYKTKNYKKKVKRLRHSKQMKNALSNRIKVEHTNSILRRSFKRLSTVYDKSMKTFNGFVEIAIICILINENIKKQT